MLQTQFIAEKRDIFIRKFKQGTILNDERDLRDQLFVFGDARGFPERIDDDGDIHVLPRRP